MAELDRHAPSGAPDELAPAPERSTAARVLRTVAWGLARVSSIVVLAVAWEWFARSGAVTPFMLPRLSLVLERIWSDLLTGDLLMNTGVTVYRAMAGFAIAAVAGTVLGMAISRGRLAHWFFDPIISVGFPMPKIAFLPVVILWLGVYDVSKISMVVLDAIFPVVTATVIGIRGVERELIWSARNMGASERELLWQIAVPRRAPADHHGVAGGASHRAHRRGRDRDADGRLRPRRRDDDGVAFRGFARRLRRHRGDRRGRLRAGQGNDDRAAALVAVASGGAGAEHGVTLTDATAAAPPARPASARARRCKAPTR